MKYYWDAVIFIFLVLQISCSSYNPNFTIAFGSCNNQVLENNLWEPIQLHNPDVWIWGGDVIYSDTENMNYLKQNYDVQKKEAGYAAFSKSFEVHGVWDDHDYGKNDGGLEYSKKEESQQLFLDFLEVKDDDERRNRAGIYYSREFKASKHSIKVILLDTRYFRSSLTRDTITGKRYRPSADGLGTILGKEQWSWLKNELEQSNADFNIIVSSIQFLSAEHGYETWGNMPHEVEKLEKLLRESQVNNLIILSGDRHISEISKKEVEGLPYPIIDFTSSGMTHSYATFKSEPNRYRVGSVISEKSYGLLNFDFNNKQVIMEIRGENDQLYYSYEQKYD